MPTVHPPFKRYCKTLQLKNDPDLIREYKKIHENGGIWPEVGKSMKQVGILDMELYLHGHTLFMIMDTVPEFDHDRDLARLGQLPRQAEWEAFAGRFQQSDPSSSAKEKWQLMERIFEMDQTTDYPAIEGQLKP